MKIQGIMRGIITFSGLLLIWELFVLITGVPPFLLPSPTQVAIVLWERSDYLLGHAAITAAEITLGLLLGTILGSTSAILITISTSIKRWLMPVLIVSQAVPVFAIAPLLVLWLGYGLASKVAMATLIIYFPVVAAFYDGLRRTEYRWIDLAHVMTGGSRKWAVLWHIQVPAALPSLASGIRVAAAVAPIGAIVGEWVGSSAGLGYAMLHANGRMQTDLMFGALAVLAVMALLLYFTLDKALSWALPWQPEVSKSNYFKPNQRTQ